MKKIYFLLCAFTFALATYAQEESSEILKSKKGTPIMPEEKEFAIGISANQFLNYVTRGAANPSFTYVSNPTNVPIALFGKMMLTPNKSIRARVALNSSSNTERRAVLKNSLTPDAIAPSFLEDWRTVNATQLLFAGGYEFRRGKGRLQGVYGGEAFFSLTGDRVNYQYGNAITADFNQPNTTNFFTGNILTTNGFSRVLSEKNNMNIGFGVRAFVGVEYFFAPKISIGGEFGYTLGIRGAGRILVTSETWDASADSLREIQTNSFRDGGVRSFGAGVDNLNGAINVLFYF